jgi:hypothetical protein
MLAACQNATGGADSSLMGREARTVAIVNAANTSLLGGGATWNSTRIGEHHDETSAVSRFHRHGAIRRVGRVGASALQHFVRKSRVPV